MAITGKELLELVKEEKKKKNTSSTTTNTSSSPITGAQLLEEAKKSKRYNSIDTSGVDDKYLDSFVTDANSFFSGVGDSSISYTDATSRLSDLSTRYDTLQAWLYKNKSRLDEESYSSLASTLDAFNSNFTTIKDYYGKFETEEDYSKYQMGWLDPEAESNEEVVAQRQAQYQSNKDRIGDIEEELPWYANTWLPNFVENIFLSDEKEALRNEAERREAENNQYERTQGVTDKYYVPVTEEFEQNASHRDYSNASKEELWNYDMSAVEGSTALSNGGYFDEEGNIRDSKGNIVHYATAPEIQDKLGLFLSAVENGTEMDYVQELVATNGNYTNTWGNLMQEGDTSGWRYLSEHEIKIYYDLYKREGQASAYKFLEDMTTELTRRETQAREDYINGAPLLEQIALNVASIPMSVFGGIPALVDDASKLLQGKEINPYSRAHIFSNAASDIREDTASDINNLTGNIALPWVGTTFGDVYQSIMSFADSSLASRIPGGSVLLATNAASSEMRDLYDRGASTGQIVAGGILAGAAEGFFEHYSIGELKRIRNMDEKAVKNLADWFVRTMIMGGVEASEEMATEVANTISDALVMGSQTDWVDFETFVKSVVNAGIGGFISGGIGGGLASAANHANYRDQVAQHGQSIIDEGGAEALKQLALEMYSTQTGRDAKIGTKLANKVAKNATDMRVGKLSVRMQDTITAQNRTEIEKALVDKGLSAKDAKRIAEYLGSTQALTAEQKAEIDGNEKVKAVVTELLEDPKSAISERTRNLFYARLGVKPTTLSNNAQKSGDLSVHKEVDVTNKVSKSGKTTMKTADGETVTITIDKGNPIAKVKIVDGERIVYLNTDKGKVSSADVQYASEEEALLYEAFVDMNPAFANAIIKNYDGSVPVQTYINGMREGVIVYGMHNFQAVGKDISGASYLAKLSKADQDFALKLGRAYAKSDAKKAEGNLRTVLKKAAEKAEATEGASSTETAKKSTPKGRVGYENGARAKTKSQRRMVSLAKHLASAMGINITFYDSTIAGTFGSDSNGYFDEDTNTIHLDLQNSKDDAKTIAFTLSHELVHFIKKHSPTKFNTFANFLMEQYASHGVDSSKLLANKMAELGTTDADFAYEEMICDACETMLLDSNAVVKLMELRKQDLGLFETIKLHIYELLNKIRDEYRKMNYAPTSDEAKALLKMEDVLDKLHSMFEDALVEATQNYQAVENSNKSIFGEASVDMGKTESGVKHQLKAHKAIGEASITYNDRHKAVHKAILQTGVEAMYEMAETMLPYLEEEGILPPDIPGKTIFKNGSYGRTGENTTLCVRTLTYEDFKDRVAEKVGRPLTVSESLLVSQKIYDIATEPQCIYCYVAADRKAYDDYLGEYWKSMDKYIRAMREGGNSQELYTEYLAGRKDTNQQKKRWSQWEAIAKSGKEYISAKDLATKRTRDSIIAKKNAFSEQIKDAQRYAQSASWAKTVCDYRAYKGEILKMTSKFVDMLNSEYGLRMYSFSDYTPAFIVENMQMIIDASVKGLKSLAYTKDTDYVEIFASTGQAINVSCFAKWDAELGTYVEDNRQGANWAKTKNLRKQYRNVGAVMVATNDAMVEWALKQDWVDVVIPYHIVKTGTTIANEYQWNNYTSESADRVGNKTANIYPTEHNNDFATYSNLLKERGITPRFSRWYDKVASGELTEDQYMKLVNEVRLPASELSPVVPSFNLEAAKKSFGVDNEGNVIEGGFVDKGGYMGGWYRQGVDVNQEVMAVSEDIKAGKSSLDVDYGMSKAGKEKVEARYKKQAKKIDGNGKSYWQIESEKDVFKNLTGVKELQKAAYQFILHGDKGNKIVGLVDGRNLEFIRISAQEYVYGTSSKELSTEEYKQKMRMSTSVIDLIENASISYDAPDHKNHKLFPNGFKNYQGRVGIDDTIFKYIVRVGKAKNGMIFYDIFLEVDGKVPRANRTSLIKSSTSANKISQKLPIVKKQLKKYSDKSYLDAVNRGDMEMAQRMVDEAAKESGYDSPMLYHGTNKFGFTVTDVSKSDDGISFFATDSEDTASTYSSKQKVKRVVDAEKAMSDDDIETLQHDIAELASDLAGYCCETLGIRGWVDWDYFNTKLEECFNDLENGVSASDVKDDFTEFCDELFYTFLDNYYETEYEDNPYLDDDEKITFDAFESSEEADSLADKFYSYVEQIKSKINALDRGSRSGIYALYANTEGHLVVDCNRCRWDKITADNLPDIKSPEYEGYGYRGHRYDWTTRSVAEYAKDHGYKGVTFKRLIDSGDGGSVLPATVYIFFDPQAQVKSADPVTYDDNGNVIPLSERFNSGNKDIRYQKKRDSLGNELSAEQQEYFKDSKIRDTDGTLLVVRHGTDTDFNIFDFSKAGKNGKAEGYGFYFSDEPEITKRYGTIQKELYLNITKPLYNNKRTITKAELKKLTNALIDFDIEKYKSDGLTWQDSFLSNYVDTYEFKKSRQYAVQEFVNQIWDYNTTDQDLVFEIAQADGRMYDSSAMKEFYNVLTDSIGYDGIIAEWSHPDGASKVYVTFSSEQSKYISNKTPTSDPDMRYQKKNLSNRTILANALETTIDTSTQEGQNELKWLKEYQSKIATIEAEEAQLAEINAKIREISFGKGTDRSKLKGLNDDKVMSQNRLHTYDKQLTRLESMKPIKDVLAREKEMVRKRTEEKGREALKAYKEESQRIHKEQIGQMRISKKKAVDKVRETRDKNDAKVKLQKLVLETSKWLSYPAKDDVKCPDILREPYANFLEGIDLSSKRAIEGGEPTHNDIKVANAMSSLATAIERIKTAQDPSVTTDKVLDSGYLDLPANFVEKLRTMAEDISKMMVKGDYVINRMTSTEIKQISQLIRTLNHAIREMSTLYANLRFAKVEELGDNTMSFLDSMGEAKSTNSVKDFVGWDNALPYYAFKRFGEGGESVFTGLMDAQDKLAHNASAIFEFKDKTWSDKEANEWGKDTHTIDLPSGNSLTLTTADAMGIYCLSRREQGLQHLLGGGTRVIGIKQGAKKASDSRSTLTQEDIYAIASSLTERQKKVAEAIQDFMSTVCADWGNEISMKRFLTKEFGEKHYYPIESNDENLPTKDPQAQQTDLYRLLNISATKPLTPGANNEVIIRNIFEVFTNHASDMARLNAFGLPLLDYMKWLNYNEKTINDEGQITVRGVRKSMETAYGAKARSYVINLIKDINGRHNDNGDNSFLMSMMRMQKTASVGNNLRVAFLQFTSYPRASMVLSSGSLAKGLTKVPQIEKAKKYCGIALWKSYGFYDTNIARSIEDQIMGATNIRQKIIELSMKTPELADAITWGALWNACEYEVAKTTKNKVGSEEFNREVGLKLREVVYATQVVDSVLTRSQIMRSKSGLTQTATAYMSEPTLTANILMDAAFQFQKEKRITGSAKTAWKKTGKLIGRAVGNYCALQLLTSLAESLADAWRDDDDEEFAEKFMEAFGENLVTNIIPFNKIPILSDIADLILSRFGIGFVSSDNLSTSWITQIADALDVWAEVLGEEFGGEETSKTIYNAIYKTAKALSSVTGISISGAMREVVSLWNNTAGAYDPTLKIKSYESSNEELGNELYEAIVEGDDREAESYKSQFDDEDSMHSAFRNALREGYAKGELTREEALNLLVKHGGMDSDDAYWKMKEWDYYIANGTTDGYSKYNDFYEAVRTGKNLKTVIKEYTEHGVETTTLASQITKYYKPLYIEMTSYERASLKGYLLNAYTLLGYNRADKSKDIDNWLKD